MRTFRVEVTANDGTTSIHKVMAFTSWHAIELLFYKYGMEKIQPNRAKYTAK